MQSYGFSSSRATGLVIILIGSVTSVIGSGLAAVPSTQNVPIGEISSHRSEQRPSTLARRVDLKVRRVPLRNALERLERDGIPLAYSSDIVNASIQVTCDCEQQTVGSVLRQITDKTDIVFRELTDGNVVLYTVEKTTPVRSASIRGRVMDSESGSGLSGVVVTIVDQRRQAMTQENGAYLITDVPTGPQQIRAERLGYHPVEQLINVPSDGVLAVNLVMRINPIALSPLEAKVSTGSVIATEAKRIGNAMVVISEEEVTLSGAQNLVDLLKGRAVGVMSIINSGQNGAGGHIQLRGASSFFMEQGPLIYVDGVPVDGGNSGLNRRGMINGEGDTNVGTGIRLDEISIDQIERVEIVKGPAATTMYGTDAINGVIQIFTKRGTPGQTRITARMQQGVSLLKIGGTFIESSFFRDQLRDLFKDPRTQNYSTAINGGFGDVSYTLSVTHDRNAGVVVGNDEGQTGIRTSIRAVPKEQLSVLVSGNFVQRSFNSREYRQLFQYADLGITETSFRPSSIEDALENGNRTSTRVSRLYGAATVNYQPLSIWQNRITLGVDQSTERNETVGIGVPTDGITRQFIQREFRRWSANYVATLAYPQIGTVTSTFSFGAQGQRDETQRFRFRGIHLPSRQVTSFDQAEQFLGGDSNNPTDLYSAVASIGFFAQEQIGFYDKLFLTGGIRVDGNSSFGSDFGLQAYPKAAISYVLEPASNWTTKLRAAWGKSGKAPQPFASKLTFSLGRDRMSQAPMLKISDVGNEQLRPEVGSEYEVGIENYFWNNRASVEVNAFQQTTVDAMLRSPISAVTGVFRGPQANIGGLRSRGVELAARVTPIRRPGTTLVLGLNATHMFENGMVTDIGEYGFLSFSNQTAAWRILDGIEVGRSIRDLIFHSLYTTGDDPFGDKESAGSRLPKTFGGVNADLQAFGGFRIYANMTYGFGGRGFDYVLASRDVAAGLVPSVSTFDPDVAKTRYVFNTDYVRMDMLRVLYRVPSNLIRSIGDDVEVWAEATNLFTLEKIGRGDVTTAMVDGARAGTTGVVDYVVPTPQAYRVGIKVTF